LPGAARLIPLGGTIDHVADRVDPHLASYKLGNPRIGARSESGAFLNNLTNENAQLALDYERGRSARVAYIVNQPRTVGLSSRLNF
jgi:iron complex outermembrane recepter protein